MRTDRARSFDRRLDARPSGPSRCPRIIRQRKPATPSPARRCGSLSGSRPAAPPTCSYAGLSAQLRKHIPGNPTVVVQNMTGAGGSVAANYTYERAAPDGLTIVFNTFHPLAQALGDRHAGALRPVRVCRRRSAISASTTCGRDVVPGGAKKPADIMKAETVMVGALSHSDFSGTLGQLSLKVLGVKYKPVVGYRGGADIFLAMQRGEVHFHNTSIGTFRTRSAAFVKSGEGLGISYLVPVDASGNYQRSELVTEMPAYPDLYKEIHGKLPAGKDWDAFNWLTNQVGELAFIALAAPKVPPAALEALRIGFERATKDADFVNEHGETERRSRTATSAVPRGQGVIRDLAGVSPAVMRHAARGDRADRTNQREDKKEMKTADILLRASHRASATLATAAQARPFNDPRAEQHPGDRDRRRLREPAARSRRATHRSLPRPAARCRHNPSTLAIRWTGFANFELSYKGQIVLLDAYFDRGSHLPAARLQGGRRHAGERHPDRAWPPRSHVGRRVGRHPNRRHHRRRAADDRRSCSPSRSIRKKSGP